MTAKLLYQFDTDWTPSVFDSVVAFDGGGAVFAQDRRTRPDAALDGAAVITEATYETVKQRLA